MGDYREYVEMRNHFLKEDDQGLGAVTKMYDLVTQDRMHNSPNLAKDEERAILTGYAADSIHGVPHDPYDLESWYSSSNQHLSAMQKDGVNANALSDVLDVMFIDRFAAAYRTDAAEAIAAQNSLKSNLAGEDQAVPKEVVALQNKMLALEDLALASTQLESDNPDVARAQLFFNEARAALTKSEQLGAHAANAERAVRRVRAQMQFVANDFR